MAWLIAWTNVALADPVEPFRLSVVSYNVWGVPHIAPDRVERIEAIGERLAAMDIDVVALQEVWLVQDAQRLARLLAKTGLVHHQHFSVFDGVSSRSGLWVASRYPMDLIRFEAFRAGKQISIPWHLDWVADKGLATLRLRTPAGDIKLANTHLQAQYTFVKHTFVQLAQAMQIGKALAPDLRDEWPLIVVGDLNVLPGSLPFRVMTSRAALRAAGPLDIEAALSRNGAGIELSVIEIKRLFVDPVRLASGKVRMLSDHPSLLVRYSLKACNACATPRSKNWPMVAKETMQALRDEVVVTKRIIVVGRATCVFLFFVALWLARRVWRRTTHEGSVTRKRKVAYGLAGAALLSVVTWFGYIGWAFGPYKLERLSVQAAGIAATR